MENKSSLEQNKNETITEKDHSEQDIDTGVEENVTEKESEIKDKKENNEQENKLGNMIVTLMKQEVCTTIDSLINEIDLSFEYVDKAIIKNLKSKLSNLRNIDKFNETLELLNSCLSKYESELSYIVLTKNKKRTQDYNFLNELKFFDLDFQVFGNENKNTKQTLVKYLYNIYMASSVIKQNRNSESGEFDLSNFIKEIESKTQNLKINKSSKKGTKSQPVKFDKQSHRNLPKLGNGLDKVMESMMGNTQLMELANDITQDLQSKNVDPMSLLSGLITGKGNNQLNDIVKNISSKLETKINTGELNKEELENQAMGMMDLVKNVDLGNQMPMLNSLLKNFPK